jgi:hypothetical protein
LPMTRGRSAGSCTLEHTEASGDVSKTCRYFGVQRRRLSLGESQPGEPLVRCRQHRLPEYMPEFRMGDVAVCPGQAAAGLDYCVCIEVV